PRYHQGISPEVAWERDENPSGGWDYEDNPGGPPPGGRADHLPRRGAHGRGLSPTTAQTWVVGFVVPAGRRPVGSCCKDAAPSGGIRRLFFGTTTACRDNATPGQRGTCAAVATQVRRG